MSEGSGKTASSLAITEKRTTTHRSGGCVGIFFQLFDWNRRFAKKKLFSKKLLPPARANQTSKKFKGDEKMPTSKLHLITDENKGGFPNMKKHSKTDVVSGHNNNYGTRSPSLVARLMGLESMPIAREKPKKGSFTEAYDNSEKKTMNELDSNTDKANSTLEARPQKLQRTERLESKAVTRFGAESGFQIKNVLTRTRKSYHNHNNHHPKFVSPVKSPRRSNSRTSRLIDAAARILEPGLQSSGKKPALSYPNRDPLGYKSDITDLFSIGQSACKSCGNSVDANCSVDQDSAVIPPYGSRTSEPVCHEEPYSSLFKPRQGLAPWPSSSQEVPPRRDRTPPRAISKPSDFEGRRVAVPFSDPRHVRGTKDFVSLNRNLIGARARPRGPARTESLDGKFLPQPRSPARKRRTTNAIGHVESRGFVGSAAPRQRNADARSDSVAEKGFRSRLAGPRGLDDETKSRKASPLKGDSIAALLELKLKELTSQEDEEFAIGDSPKKSTATILQELISALSAERPDIASASNAETKHEKPTGIFNVTDHLSPGSVLEASFSSSSHDDSSGHILYTDSVDYSSDPLHCVGPDLDSVSSSRKETNGFERATVLVNTVSRVLDAINLAGGRLTEIGLTHAKQVVVSAELLFGNVHLQRLEGLERLFLGPILLELEAIANVAWSNINVLTGSDPTKSGNQYRGFLFDCLIECLEFKYGKYPDLGFGAWTRLPRCVDRETIIGDVEREMKKWTSFVGMFADEIIEWEMSHGIGKWTCFDIEAFEIGNKACDDILEDLVVETLVDLWE